MSVTPELWGITPERAAMYERMGVSDASLERRLGADEPEAWLAERAWLAPDDITRACAQDIRDAFATSRAPNIVAKAWLRGQAEGDWRAMVVVRGLAAMGLWP